MRLSDLALTLSHKSDPRGPLVRALRTHFSANRASKCLKITFFTAISQLFYYVCRNVYIGIYGQRLRGRVSLISHPYGDLSAPYLGTAILTILCFLYLISIPFDNEHTM